MEWFGILLQAGFEPHATHFYATPVLLWTLVGANTLIALAYFTIPLGLLYFLKHRKQLKYPKLTLLFAAFILACAVHHTVHVLTFWSGLYYLQAFADVITAVVSLAAAFVLWRVIPAALHMPTPKEHADIRHQVEEKEQEISTHKLLEEKRKQMMSMIGHELRSPITSQLLLSEMLVIKAKQDRLTHYTEHLETILHQSNKLKKLVDDLVEMAQHEGEIPYTFEYIDINQAVYEAVQECRIITSTHFIKVRGRVRKKVYADHVRIVQVLTNLISNAIKYSPHARKVLVVLKEREGGVEVSVQDYGIGIEPQYKQKIFEPFFRVQDERVATSGMGMGLHITSRIVAAHNGTIDVRSEKGKGSTFSFTLPHKTKV